MNAIQTRQTKTNHSVRIVNHKPASAPSAEASSRFGKSIGDLLASIYGGLARTNATVEDISIRQNQVVVKYRTPDSEAKGYTETLLNDESVEVSNIAVYSLGNGQVIERYNPVYQIKR